MPNSGLSQDLEVLATLEKTTRNATTEKLKDIALFTLTVTVVLASIIVAIAWFSAVEREQDLKEELGCLRTSSVKMERELVESLVVLIDTNQLALVTVGAIYEEDFPRAQAALNSTSSLITSGNRAQKELRSAMVNREQALDRC